MSSKRAPNIRQAWSRRGVTAVAAATVMSIQGAAHAAGPDEREQCATSAEQAQLLRDEGKYRRAREQMLFCAREVCPGPIKSDCSKWLAELDRDAPTVVFGARDDKGADVLDTRVSMDGVVIQERLDGKPVVVDAGEHTFTFQTKSGAVKEQRVLIRTAEKARAITVDFEAGAEVTKAGSSPSSPGSDTDSDRSLVPALIVGGVGVVALGSAAYFGLSGINAVDDLQQRNCKPYCPADEVDSAQSKLIVSDISLGVGVVALAVATYMIVTRGSGAATAQAKSAADRSSRPKIRLDAAPRPGGAFAGLRGRF